MVPNRFNLFTDHPVLARVDEYGLSEETKNILESDLISSGYENIVVEKVFLTRIILPDGTGREVWCRPFKVGDHINSGDIKEWRGLGGYSVYDVRKGTYTSPAGNKSRPQFSCTIYHVLVS